MTSNVGENRQGLFAKDEIERSLVARLAQMVELHAARVVLRDEQRSLTYAELGLRVSAVAKAILSLQPDDPTPVALILDHGADMVIALLGVIAAGRAYVPVDPAVPGLSQLARTRLRLSRHAAGAPGRRRLVSQRRREVPCPFSR